MKITELIKNIIFCNRCAACGELLPVNQEDCFCCGSEMQRLSFDTCECCGSEREECSCDSKLSAKLEHITGVYLYSGLVKNRLLRFKFGHQKEYGKIFADKMSERAAIVYAAVDFDLITFVPSSEKDAYNTAEILSRYMSKKLFIPFAGTLVKSMQTEKQHTLTAAERMVNVRNSLSLLKGADVKGKTVLICDDIKTTGATLAECCRVLKNAGAKDVYCITAAVTSNL